ncbi:MAG TPA: NADH-quinone oxidoreductase subunit J [Pirellulaceae bacterium]|nr:NADH-quinone oxidoreductase subunit J [Pirellulaceae bacterium]
MNDALLLPALLAASTWYQLPITWAIVLGALTLMLVIPRSSPLFRALGGVFAALSGGCLIGAMITSTRDLPSPDLVAWAVFLLLATTTVGSAVAMVGSRSAVYSAIWFALTLLGTGGLFLYQGAQFLGVATVVVYAGAIVVTFLFVIMLAQPDGHASYDRISWGWFAKPAAAMVGAILLGGVVYSLQGVAAGELREQVAAAADELVARDADFPLSGRQVVKASLSPASQALRVTLRSDAKDLQLSDDQRSALEAAVLTKLTAAAGEDDAPVRPFKLQLDPALKSHQDLLSQGHMAHFGGYLFSRHLIAVEVAGTLLLAALVGAVAMLSQGAAVGRHAGEKHV